MGDQKQAKDRELSGEKAGLAKLKLAEHNYPSMLM